MLILEDLIEKMGFKTRVINYAIQYLANVI
jgi:hypothetical protein